MLVISFEETVSKIKDALETVATQKSPVVLSENKNPTLVTLFDIINKFGKIIVIVWECFDSPASILDTNSVFAEKTGRSSCFFIFSTPPCFRKAGVFLSGEFFNFFEFSE